jgi:hypothetical protein
MTTAFWDFYLKADGAGSTEKRKAYIEHMRTLAGPQDQLKFD